MFLLCAHQDFQLNRVVMEEVAGAEPSPAGARPKKKNRKTYDLTAVDKFWQKHKGRSVFLEGVGGLFFFFTNVQIIGFKYGVLINIPFANNKTR